MVTLEELRALCLEMPHVTEDIKWEEHLCFSVAKKMFIIISPDDVPVNASFKTSIEKFNELTELEGFQPAPYLGRYHWTYIHDISMLTEPEWKEIINEAYRLVFEKLPKKVQRELNEK